MFFKNLLSLSCNFIDVMLELTIIEIEARIAQLVEQWIEDPRVTSSNLVLGILISKISEFHSLFVKLKFNCSSRAISMFCHNKFHVF